MAAALSWENFFTSANVTLSGAVAGSLVTSESFDAAYPAANMFNPDPSKVTRINYVRNATGGGYSRVQAAFSTTLAQQRSTARLISFINCRIPADCTQILMLGQDYLGTVSVASVTILAANMVPKPGTTDRYDFHLLASAASNLSSVSFYVYVPASTSGYWEIGHVWAGPALLLPLGVDSNWSMGFIDPSDVERSRGGALVAQQLPRRRRLRAPITAQSYTTAFGTPGTASALSLRKMSLEAGLGTPVIAIPRSDSEHTLQVASLYGALTELRDISHQGGDQYGTDITVEEIR